MKTQSKKTVELVLALHQAIEARKDLERTEKALKEQVRAIMGDETTLVAGDVVIALAERTRLDLNKDAIMHDFGHEFFAKYEVKSTYTIMNVTQNQKQGVGS